MAMETESYPAVAHDISDRLREARLAAGYVRMADAMRAFGWTKQYSQHERGDRKPPRDTLAKYAAAFRVSVDWLITGRGRGPNISARVNLMGKLGAGAQIAPNPDGSRLETVERPLDDINSIGAAIVHGFELSPQFRDGDVVYWRAPEAPENLLGYECVIKMPDGRLLIRTLERGSSPGLFTLIAYAGGAGAARDVSITEASLITYIKKAAPAVR